ncbi:MAG TPA: hypothetical protein VF173_04380 [Thermoanaerobaculia bacterium]|nr:hypothetical protein [Thermoanaerobaculia bacterium]
MTRKVKVWIGLLGTLSVLGLLSALLYQPAPGTAGPAVIAAKVNTAALRSDFQDWSARHTASGGDHNVIFSLGWAKGLSREDTEAEGLARLDLVSSSARLELKGMPAGNWDVWLVQNMPGGTMVPEATDRMHRLGSLTTDGSKVAQLSARLEPGFFDRFRADLMVVTRAGGRPEKDGVLYGSPDLFQRMYTKAKEKPSLAPSHPSMLASLFGPRVASATPFDSTDALVAKGFDLFFNEKFGGNGRTCGTCHPSDNNFTIDPKYIATLAPDDPLFVAERQPALAANFENPTLLRAMGLVLENVDGFQDLQHKFVLRAVPHLLGLRNSRVPQIGSPIPPAERLGWGGDGSPLSGTIRDFAVGAINQHFTKTLNRVPDVDFRFPTDDELDALAAFQLALGRQADINLPAMQFKSPLAARGQQIFLAFDTQGGTVAAGKCNLCHGNAGALGQDGDNRNFEIGSENIKDHPADVILPGARPRDGGQGRGANPLGGFGNDRFNTPVVIESADTGPYFHDNSAATLEEAIEFYNTAAFQNSQVGLSFRAADTGGIGIHLESTQVGAVAALLRVLNALENIRSSTELDQAAQGHHDKRQAQMLLDLAALDTRDAINVLETRGLHLDAVAKLKQAYDLETDDGNNGQGNGGDHKSKKDDGHGHGHDDDRFTQILQLKADAKALMIVVTP